MNETQVTGAQAGEPQGTEDQGKPTVAGDAPADGMAAAGHGRDSPDVAQLRRLRLRGFLRELVRAEGRMAAAELLGVNYKTLARAETSGVITRRMRDALERLLGTGDDPDVARLRAAGGGRGVGGAPGGAGGRRGGAGQGTAPRTTPRSTARRGRWWRSGDGGGPTIPTGGRAWPG